MLLFIVLLWTCRAFIYTIKYHSMFLSNPIIIHSIFKISKLLLRNGFNVLESIQLKIKCWVIFIVKLVISLRSSFIFTRHFYFTNILAEPDSLLWNLKFYILAKIMTLKLTQKLAWETHYKKYHEFTILSSTVLFKIISLPWDICVYFCRYIYIEVTFFYFITFHL